MNMLSRLSGWLIIITQHDMIIKGVGGILMSNTLAEKRDVFIQQPLYTRLYISHFTEHIRKQATWT